VDGKEGQERKSDADGKNKKKKKTGTPNKKPPAKVVESKMAAGSVASASNRKTVVSLMDESTEGEISSLANTQHKLAKAKLELLENEKRLNGLKLQMHKFQMLKDLREGNPSLTKSQVVQLFPDLADIAEIVMVDDDESDD
jgi:hypothetical protein